MTPADARSAGPRHARIVPPAAVAVPPAARIAPAASRPVGGPRHARADVPFATVPPQRTAYPLAHPAEPPAGLGPWVPQLPEPERGPSRATWAWLGTFVVAVVLGTIALVASGVAASGHSAEAGYVASVRQSSALTRSDVSDDELVTTGRAVCSALDAHPSRFGLLGVFSALTGTARWSGQEAAAVVGAAVDSFCPAHRPLIGG